MDTTDFIIDERLKQKAKSARLFSIISLALAGVYLLEGILSLLLSLFPIPFLGLVLFVALLVVEFCLFSAIVVFLILSFVRIGSTKKDLFSIPESIEKKELESIVSMSTVLTWISFGVTVLIFIVMSILNILELILSII